MFGSACGSPGASSLALMVAQAFPRRPFLVEADPAGGRLALRYGLSVNDGLVRLAGTSRLLSADNLDACSLEIGNARVVCAPPRAGAVRAALTQLDARWVTCPDPLDIIVDAGRLSPLTPAGLLRRSQLVVLVLRPVPEEVGVVQGLIAELRGAGRLVKIACVGDAPYRPDEVAQHLDVELLCTIPDNADSVARIVAGEARGWKSITGRTVRDVAALLATDFADRPVLNSTHFDDEFAREEVS
jgi:hypothetical protein